MTLGELLATAHAWSVANANWVLLGAVIVPLLGTLFAWWGRGGRTDADGRFVASLVVGIGVLAVVVEVVVAAVGVGLYGRSLLDEDVRVLAAPVVCLAGCLVGIRRVFPLSQLASVRTFLDVGAFLLACLAVAWIASQFRGWGILFVGGILQLAALVVLGAWLLRRLYERAFGRA